jgi:hypothetical protein
MTLAISLSGAPTFIMYDQARLAMKALALHKEMPEGWFWVEATLAYAVLISFALLGALIATSELRTVFYDEKVITRHWIKKVEIRWDQISSLKVDYLYGEPSVLKISADTKRTWINLAFYEHPNQVIDFIKDRWEESMSNGVQHFRNG